MKDRTMALAGLFQSTELARQAATHGTWSGYAAETCLASLLRVESESVDDIYGGRQKVMIGLETLVSVLRGENRHLDSLRYAVGLLQIERKFRKQSGIQAHVGKTLDEIGSEFFGGEQDSAGADLAAERVADLYLETISNISPRIVVNGNPRYLQMDRTVSWIRTLLFAGLRSAVLWNQLGGGRWNLMFGRKQMLRDAESLLSG